LFVALQRTAPAPPPPPPATSTSTCRCRIYLLFHHLLLAPWALGLRNEAICDIGHGASASR
jgi:hypothetical protein